MDMRFEMAAEVQFMGASGENMELKNFGGILSFAAELEAGAKLFYSRAAQNPACSFQKQIFEALFKEHGQYEQRILRIRRENVTEMILEPIRDFTRAPFVMEYGDPEAMNFETVLETARKIESRSEHYYFEAAEKVKALPEVARELKKIGQKHAFHREKLG